MSFRHLPDGDRWTAFENVVLNRILLANPRTWQAFLKKSYKCNRGDAGNAPGGPEAGVAAGLQDPYSAVVSAGARASSAKRAAGTAGEKRKPWNSSQPKARRRASCADVSTPSA